MVPELIEVFLGDWDGGEFRVRLSEGDPIALQAVDEERWDLIPGAETMEALALRVRAGIETVIAAAGPGRLGGRDRARRRHRRGLPAGHRRAGRSRSCTTRTPRLSRLVVLPGGHWLLRSFNDTAHLASAA